MPREAVIFLFWAMKTAVRKSSASRFDTPAAPDLLQRTGSHVAAASKRPRRGPPGPQALPQLFSMLS